MSYKNLAADTTVRNMWYNNLHNLSEVVICLN